jgi:hypothetical protein
MHCTIMLLAHIWRIYPLGHVYAEPELKEPTEQAQAEEFTNLVWIKASPGESHQSSLAFLSIFIIMFCLIVYLSL